MRALVFAVFTGTVFTSLASSGETPSSKPSHRVLGADRGKVAIVGERGEVEWQWPTTYQVHDIARLKNGNVLFQSGADSLVEVSADKRVVWKYHATPRSPYRGPIEIHSFHRLEDGLTMVAETGNRRIVEVDHDGKVVHEIPLVVNRPDPHRDTRLARKLANGHYLVCHEGDGAVREYDRTGKVVWSYQLDLGGRPRTGGHDGHGTEVFGALRKSDGNTIIAAGNGNRVIEVNPEGKIVWSIEHNELPDIRLFWVTTLKLLPNGNLIFGNCHAGPENPQLVEVTRDKKVVWTFKDFQTFGNDLAAATVLDE
ncbi:MAG: PQQ-like beta-propeller repeat protein [Isosphaeraceae bacterium]